jgi:hypothetical protein
LLKVIYQHKNRFHFRISKFFEKDLATNIRGCKGFLKVTIVTRVTQVTRLTGVTKVTSTCHTSHTSRTSHTSHKLFTVNYRVIQGVLSNLVLSVIFQSKIKRTHFLAEKGSFFPLIRGQNSTKNIFQKVLHVINLILNENEFQNPQIFQQTISLFPAQSTLFLVVINRSLLLLYSFSQSFSDVRVRGLRLSPKISDFENPSDSDSVCLFVYAFIL